MDLGVLRGWLDLTEREFEILRVVFYLQNQGVKASPENISREIKALTGRRVLKPNLFHLLKKLRQQDYLTKAGFGVYEINKDGLKAALEGREKKLDAQKQRLGEVRRDVEGSLQKLSWQLIQPKVEYLEYRDFYLRMGQSIKNSTVFSVVASFPQLAYSRRLIEGLERGDYLNPLYQEAVKKKRIRLQYLTDLDLDYLFNHCFRVHRDPTHAYHECQNTLNNLESLVDDTENIDIRYHEDPHGLDVAIQEIRNPQEFFLFIRDEHDDVMAGLLIQSPDTSRNAHKMFQRGYEYATPLNTAAGKKILKKTKQKLTKKYSILE